jgi:hypothetical protein
VIMIEHGCATTVTNPETVLWTGEDGMDFEGARELGHAKSETKS